jgi:hypothetical protein
MDHVVEFWMGVLRMAATRKEMNENMDDWWAANGKAIEFALRLFVALGLAETSDAAADAAEAILPTKNLLNILNCCMAYKVKPSKRFHSITFH